MTLEDKLKKKTNDFNALHKTGDQWSLANYEIPSDYIGNKDHIDILLWGDVHLGSNYCDRTFAKESLDRTMDRGVYIIGMGDLLETATRDSIGAGVYQQDEIVQGQLEEMEEWLKPHKDRIIGLLDGNHEHRLFISSGLNLTKILAKNVGTKYLGAGRLLRIRAGNQTYSVYITHGSSGATLPYTKIKQCLNLQQYIDADCYCMGHVHALDSHSRAVHELDKRTRQVVENEKLFVLSGHYLNYFGSYAHRKGLIPSKKGSPVLKLYTDEKKIRVSI